MRNWMLTIEAAILLHSDYRTTPKRNRSSPFNTGKAMGVLDFGNRDQWDFVMNEIVWC